MSVGNNGIPDAFLGIARHCPTASRNPLYKLFSSVFHRIETEKGKGGKNRTKATVLLSLPSPPSVLSSLPSLAVVLPSSATLGCKDFNDAKKGKVKMLFHH
ncbi:hypothetical protein E6C27_scaffold205G00660 [Cucumis melo var. makuwa]|uniref:Uncharacterized protein n=1 Tax=Cucumis melo var. makuwa TaxID=1194695 RepID=A0A5A7V7N0_CUCMM|nr:hypothetical protein E6C27_scaffold205G00660 [Cucumis melo var. makuwa]